MNVQISQKKPGELSADVFVVPVAEGAETAGAVRELGKAARDLIEARVKWQTFKAKAGKQLVVQTPEGDVVLVGCGEEVTTEAARRAGAGGRAAAASLRAKSAVLCVGSGAGARKIAAPLAEGFLLNGYRFTKYQSQRDADEREPEITKVVLAGSGLKSADGTRAELDKVQSVCDAVFLARDLINEMSSVKTPTYIARQARKLAKGDSVRCEVWQGEKLRKERMNGILRVSAGSNEPGAFIKLVYKPKRKAKAVVAVVGKGITFDSGGLSIKPAKSMEWMKQDMSGAAAVLGVVKAASELALPVEVRGYIASAENMTGGGAQKPGDIITYRNGTTAEVLNTDAEGRLVLGDALCVAAEEKPDCIIDLATLTGACMVALGTRVAGVMGNDQRLVDALLEHGTATGEPLWQLPLVEDYVEDIRSSTADIQNIGAGYAGTITAALFLRSFVGKAKWAHLDIAGPAFAEKPHPYATKGGTGFGIRLLVSYLSSL